MNKIYDALIFDIDGTLWNASASSAAGWTKGLANLGINRVITKSEIESVAGNPYSDCIRMLIKNPSISYEKIETEFNKQERQPILEMGGDIYEGVISGMSALKEKYPLFLVSNCQNWYYDIFMGKSGLSDYITDSDCHGRSDLCKADMISSLVKKHDLKNPVYIGDTKGDYLSAKAAGVQFFHAAYGFGDLSAEPIEDKFRFSSFNEIVSCFG